MWSKMLVVIATFVMISVAVGSETSLNRTDLMCSGEPYYNVTLTAYYPDYSSDNESDYLDIKGKKLRTLQDYIDGRAEYVTVAIDHLGTGVAYGANLCVPELNEHFGQRIKLQARDYGSNLQGSGLSRLDICVRSEMDSYDRAVNKVVTVYA